MDLEITPMATRYKTKMPTGILPSTNTSVNKGLVFNRLSSHSPPNNATKIMTKVKQPTWAATVANVRFKVDSPGFGPDCWLLPKDIVRELYLENRRRTKDGGRKKTFVLRLSSFIR